MGLGLSIVGEVGLGAHYCGMIWTGGLLLWGGLNYSLTIVRWVEVAKFWLNDSQVIILLFFPDVFLSKTSGNNV